MVKRNRDQQVTILVDLDEYHKSYGTMNKLEPNTANVRNMVDDRRTMVLRNMFKRAFLNAPFCDVSGHSEFVDGPDVEDHMSYIREYLTDDGDQNDSATEASDFYYMNLTQSESNPNSFYIEIILKRGFLNYLKENPSERLKVLLQEVLNALHENNITDRDIVGYYMGLSLKSNNSFESNFINFLGENNA